MNQQFDQWRRDMISRLPSDAIVGYHADEPVAAEPTAISALMAIGYDMPVIAKAACERLMHAQLSGGEVSVYLDDQGPYWPTSLAVIAWHQYAQRFADDFAASCVEARDRGIDHLLGCGGEVIPRNKIIGHNSELQGWPWVLGTHSWLEPTALALMALRHTGHQSHARAIEAAELLLDRQLTTGGANYGNTFVLGQLLRAHVLPSAMSVVALHQTIPAPHRLTATIRYLQEELNRPLAATSLAWTIHALVSASWDSSAGSLEYEWPIAEAIARLQRVDPNPHRHHLLMLAILGRESPLLAMPTWDMKQVKDRESA